QGKQWYILKIYINHARLNSIYHESKGCEIMKGKKPIFIDLVDEDDEGNDDTIQQNERNNDQSTQQNERNNDSNESALQMQVE
ncbi:17440_t:CDS:2, partial [Rhizophagus irregularis]